MTTAIMTETNFDRTAGALIGLARAAEGLDLPAKMEPLLYSALSSLPQLHASGNSGNEARSFPSIRQRPSWYRTVPPVSLPAAGQPTIL